MYLKTMAPIEQTCFFYKNELKILIFQLSIFERTKKNDELNLSEEKKS